MKIGRHLPSGCALTMVLLVAWAGGIGCSHPVPGTLTALVDRPAAGYLCPLLAQTPEQDVSLTWRFGDGSEREKAALCLHLWSEPGRYEVSALAADGRTWKGTIDVAPPQGVTDLRATLGLPCPEPEDGSSGATLVVYRPDEGLVAPLADPDAVAGLLRGIREVCPVTAGPRPSNTPQVFVYDRGGACVGMIRYGDGVLELALGPVLTPAGSFLVKEDSVSSVVAAVRSWTPGLVWKGRIVPGELPLSSLPRECLGIVQPPDAAANPVGDYGLADYATLTIAGHDQAWVTLTRDQSDFDYILGLLAGSAAADTSEVQGLPEDWYTLPWVTIQLESPAEGGGTVVGLYRQGHVLWCRSTDAEAPQDLYFMTPQLEECLSRLAEVLGRGG